MAYSIQTAVSDGTLEVLDLSIKYMDKSHIFVYIDDVLVDGSTYSYVWLTDTRIQVVPAVANGSTLKVIRKTLTDEMWHEFSKGARFSTTSMDDNFEQLLFLAQEYSEGIYVSDFYSDVDLHLRRILNLGDPVNDLDAVNLKTLKAYLPNAELIPPITERVTALENTRVPFTTLFASAGSSLVGFIQKGVGAVARWVQDKLRETVSVGDFMTPAQRADILTGTPTIDVAPAIQAAIDAVGENARIIYPAGTYLIATDITVRPQQKHDYHGSVFKVAANVQMYKRGTNGYPGRVSFDGIARFEGTGKTGRAISITNNTPFVRIGDHLHFENFNIPVLLDGSYSSYVGGTYVGNEFGPHLLNECHDTVVNVKSDQNVETAACLNGNPVDGSLGTIPVHNVTFLGYYQNTKHGLWLENCYETRLQNIYHEGNTHSDVKLGVADGGVYARAAYHTVVDGWQSSSPCASGRNWDVEHAVGAHMVGLAFNAGTSSTATVFAADGYSDQIDIDYQRVQHATVGTTAPFSVPAGRAIIRHNGASTFPFTRKYLKFGPVGAEVGALWGTYTSGGRPTVQLESLGPSQDMTFKVQDIERHENSAGVSGFQIDHINSRTDTAYLLRPTVDNTLALGEVERRWSVVCAGSSSIVTSDERSKTSVQPIPQEWLDAWGDVEFVRYKFRDAVAVKADNARWHVGVIAQRVKEAFEARGIDPFEIGILCYDKWGERVDVDGNIQPAGELYGIRYEEALVLECAYLRSKLK